MPGEYILGESSGGLGPDDCMMWINYSTYCMSVAGLFSPEVFADNGDGEYWTEPWTMPTGYKVPSFGQVRYPTLKTHMLEFRWLQNLKSPCNGSFMGCEPYYFNLRAQTTVALARRLEGQAADPFDTTYSSPGGTT